MTDLRASSPLAACPACARLERARRGEDDLFIARGRESIILLHKFQAYPGWCSVFLADHHEHLADLSRERQARLWEDVMDVANAIRAAFQPRRLNYENLGNVVAHVHWHIIPRYERPLDPEPGATVWTRPDAERDVPVSAERAAELIAALRGTGYFGVSG